MNFSTFLHTHTHAHMKPTLASAKATTTNCNCYSRLLLLLLFLLGSNKRLGAQTCSLCVGVATARMLRQLSCCCDAHTQLTEVQTLLLLCCCCCGCACVVSICILGARFAGVFFVAVATVRPHSNRTWCKALGGGERAHYIILYHISVESKHNM